MTQSKQALFRHLYGSYYHHVFAFCRRRVSADAVDDVVADVFLVAWRRISDAPEGEAGLGWLYRIAYHVTGNHWRGRGRRKKLEAKLESVGVNSKPLIQDQVVVREEVRDVMAAAQNLRERDIEVLRLSLWEHLSMDQIGEVLDITANAAKQRLHRARKNLVREYEKSQRTATPAAQKGGER